MTTYVWILGFVAVIWAVELVNAALGHRFNEFGILPRQVVGLRGIPLSPILHDGFDHLLSNTLPLMVLASLVGTQGKTRLAQVSVIVVVVGGLAVWLVGRHGVHIGASGLVFGYFGYLVARGWFERSVVSVLLAIVVVMFYGGLLFSFFQLNTFISWEGHASGLLAGGLAARVFSGESRRTTRGQKNADL